MKKKWILALAALCCVTTALGFSACDDKEATTSSLQSGFGDSTAVSQEPTMGLEYELFDEGEAVYGVVGVGSATDTHIVIPSTYNGLPVKSIRGDAFSGCSSLIAIIIPDSVIAIGDAFRDCDSLTSIMIGAGVRHINVSFDDCNSLTNIQVDKNNPYYKSIDGNLYSKGETKLIKYALGKKTKEFTIPDSVTSIEDNAFFQCRNLINIIIPDSVTSIGVAVFEYCSSLTEITIPDSVTSMNYGNAFHGCSSLTSIRMGNGSASVLFGTTFRDCSKLTNITIGKEVTLIEGFEGSFDGCDSLTSITVDENNPAYQSIDGNLYSKDGKTLIFLFNRNVTKFAIPDGVTTIKRFAFIGCKNLELMIPDSVTSIDELFAGGWQTHLISITLGKGITSIDGAFIGCSSLRSVTIPDSVTSMDYAFEDCSSLTEITIPSSITTIGSGTFAGCSSLTKITIPNSVTTIGNVMHLERGAFDGCSSLIEITIPNSVTAIAGGAFKGCNSLKRVTFENIVGWEMNGIAISSTDLANKEKAAEYLTSTAWKLFSCREL